MADIELVVKIPERIHYGVEKGITVNGSKASQILIDAVKNGTPLPKGHGRLGDLDALRDEVSSWGMNDYEPSDFTDEIDRTDTIIPADVEAIPKAEYEARLKADLKAILVELQLEIEEKEFLESSCFFMDKTEEKNYAVYTDDISKVIQQKIDVMGKINHE